MRILLMSFEYPTGKTYCGGVGQVVAQCRKTLKNLKHEVYVLISSEFRKKHPVKLLKPDGSLVDYSSLSRFLKNNPWRGFDYIIQHFVNWTKEFKKLKQKKSLKTKIIYHFHSILRREKDSGFDTLNKFLLNQEKMIDVADRIICPSRYEYDNFVRYFPSFSDKVSVVENVVETYPPEETLKQSIKRKHRIRENDIVAVYVGRLEKIKGAHILIANLPKVLRKHKNLKVFMIGKTLKSGIYRKLKKVQKEFPGQLFYIKYLPKNVLFQYYYLGDIYINTSLSESFSLSTYESASCGNALLLNRLPVFDKFKHATLFFSGQDTDKDSFGVQLESLVSNKILRKRFAVRASLVAKDFFKRNRLKKDFIKLFK